jgi:hypothetical protein
VACIWRGFGVRGPRWSVGPWSVSCRGPALLCGGRMLCACFTCSGQTTAIVAWAFRACVCPDCLARLFGILCCFAGRALPGSSSQCCMWCWGMARSRVVGIGAWWVLLVGALISPRRGNWVWLVPQWLRVPNLIASIRVGLKALGLHLVLGQVLLSWRRTTRASFGGRKATWLGPCVCILGSRWTAFRAESRLISSGGESSAIRSWHSRHWSTVCNWACWGRVWVLTWTQAH